MQIKEELLKFLLILIAVPVGALFIVVNALFIVFPYLLGHYIFGFEYWINILIQTWWLVALTLYIVSKAPRKSEVEE